MKKIPPQIKTFAMQFEQMQNYYLELSTKNLKLERELEEVKLQLRASKEKIDKYQRIFESLPGRQSTKVEYISDINRFLIKPFLPALKIGSRKIWSGIMRELLRKHGGETNLDTLVVLEIFNEANSREKFITNCLLYMLYNTKISNDELNSRFDVYNFLSTKWLGVQLQEDVKFDFEEFKEDILSSELFNNVELEERKRYDMILSSFGYEKNEANSSSEDKYLIDFIFAIAESYDGFSSQTGSLDLGEKQLQSA